MKHCLIKYAFFLAVHTQTYKNDRLFILSKMHTETTVLQTLLNVLAFYQISFHCIWNLLIIGLKSNVKVKGVWQTRALPFCRFKG